MQQLCVYIICKYIICRGELTLCVVCVQEDVCVCVRVLQFKTQKWKSLLLNSVKSKLGIIIIPDAVCCEKVGKREKFECPTGGGKTNIYCTYICI